MVRVSRACIKRPGAIREVVRNLHRCRFEPLHITLSGIDDRCSRLFVHQDAVQARETLEEATPKY